MNWFNVRLSATSPLCGSQVSRSCSFFHCGQRLTLSVCSRSFRVYGRTRPADDSFLSAQPLDLPYGLLSYIGHFADPDAFRALFLSEKRILHHTARHFLRRNATVTLGTNQKREPNIFSFDTGRLSRSLFITVDGYSDFRQHSSIIFYHGLRVHDECKPRSGA